jgi:hypothetical protein
MPFQISDPDIFDSHIGLYVAEELRVAIDVLAKANNRTRSEEVRLALAKHLVTASPTPTTSHKK